MTDSPRARRERAADHPQRRHQVLLQRRLQEDDAAGRGRRRRAPAAGGLSPGRYSHSDTTVYVILSKVYVYISLVILYK